MEPLAPLLFFVLASGAVLWLAIGPWRTAWRRARIRKQPFPAAWRRILRRRVPLFQRLPADLQLRLKQEIQVFLAEIPFLGCDGLRVSDEMRVTVAAQACLPLLGGRRTEYTELRQVLLYPAPFVVDRAQPDPENSGLQVETPRALAGESWVQGQVLLSWPDVLAGAKNPDDGYNVVIHEFAHQLDQIKGFANGAPLLPSRRAYERWSSVMQAEFDALRQRLQRDEPSLIDPYAATDPAEFFAVTSELFFECPAPLARSHPALYEQLSWFYKLHPLSWR